MNGATWPGPGRPWEEAVIYELHLGTFTEQGTFEAARQRLPYLAELGITAIELMPVAQFSGNRGWGYDGVLLYRPSPGLWNAGRNEGIHRRRPRPRPDGAARRRL